MAGWGGREGKRGLGTRPHPCHCLSPHRRRAAGPGFASGRHHRGRWHLHEHPSGTWGDLLCLRLVQLNALPQCHGPFNAYNAPQPRANVYDLGSLSAPSFNVTDVQPQHPAPRRQRIPGGLRGPPHAHRGGGIPVSLKVKRHTPGGTISANFLIVSETLKAVKGIYNANARRCQQRETRAVTSCSRARALLRFSNRSVSSATLRFPVSLAT